MLNEWQKELTRVFLGYEQRLARGELRKTMLTALGGWIAYFLVINMFVRSLNKIVIPVLDMPLGFCLAIQGTAIIFGVALYALSKVITPLDS
jgi:putative solute:sodium symporter small subunit